MDVREAPAWQVGVDSRARLSQRGPQRRHGEGAVRGAYGCEGVGLVDEEQFGPVLPIIRYSEVDEAVSLANDSQYGLSASVWGTDTAAAKSVAMRLEAGTVWVNKHAQIAPHVPLGGIKCSGIGVEFAEEGLEAYTTIRIVNVPA